MTPPASRSKRVRALLRRMRAVVHEPQPRPAPPAPSPKQWLEDRVRDRIHVELRPSRVTGHRLNLLVPTVQPDLVFGGIQTALDLFEAIGGSSERRRIVSLAPLDEAVAARWPAHRLGAPGADPDEPSQLVSIAGDDASLPVGPGDVFVATFWTTADLAIRIAAWQAETFGASPGRFGYLIQDFEPGFYPWSANHVLALATYRAPVSTVAVFNTDLLRGYFHDQALRFAHEFAFEPRLTDDLREVLGRSAGGPRERRIVLYGRPRTPRNAFPLLVDALRAWRSREPEVSDWTVVSVGQQHPDIDLGGGTIVRSLGKLDLAAYGELMRGSAIGLSFMISPHPSYPPLEMAHFGMLVLTNRFAAKDLSTWHSNIMSADDLSIEGVADALARLCRRVEADPGLGDRGVSARPDYLGDAPQFAFAAEVATLLGPTVGPTAGG
jgi:beta-1,2-rhamnosyltransferase WsaF-like protein